MDVEQIEKTYTTIRFLEIEMAGAHSSIAEVEMKLRETESNLRTAAESFIAAVTMKIVTDDKEDKNERI